MKKLILFSNLILLNACSSWFSKSETNSVVPLEIREEKKQTTYAPRKTSREIGSIWSEDSSWNTFYAPPVQRGVGDVILLRPSDSFRMSVSTKGGGGSSFESGQGANDSAAIAAVIKEVLPRNIYVVEAKQSMRVGTKDHDIDLKGKVREHDLTADDSTSTDSLFEVALGVKGPPEVTRNIASKQGSETEKPKSTEAKP